MLSHYCNAGLCLKPDCIEALKLRANALCKKGCNKAALNDKNMVNNLERISKDVAKKKQKKEKFQESSDKALLANDDGKRFFDLSHYAMAIDYYTKAINYGSNDYYLCAMFYDNRAAVYEKLNDLTNFHKDCNAALNCDKTYVNVYRRRARLLWKLGEREKAIKDHIALCVLEEYKDKDSIDTMERAIVETCSKHADEFSVKYCSTFHRISSF
ncbi:mitochondrial import receptor subunit TOM70-like protein [Leptotrombidium deliense]|uniref:Mitochondrial import receptor subunit TOM70-like protein n=1 Tax=Leptotrombidium deliense TaxID=299467 RepID=A0A443S0D2_9ACAR|nr:mitochondrial import receptor subunit TOM70-like protein [Leptotrombidium deliense]